MTHQRPDCRRPSWLSQSAAGPMLRTSSSSSSSINIVNDHGCVFSASSLALMNATCDMLRLDAVSRARPSGERADAVAAACRHRAIKRDSALLGSHDDAMSSSVVSFEVELASAERRLRPGDARGMRRVAGRRPPEADLNECMSCPSGDIMIFSTAYAESPRSS